jgi:transcriptional regulator of acetoin/glycerol metabolism
MPPDRVLVVDRDAALADALAECLSAAGHAPTVEVEGEVAGAALTTAPGDPAPDYDLVVVHLGLPGLDLALLRAALSAGGATPPDSLAAAERRHILRVLEHTGGNRRRAATALGISRSTLLNKIRKYGIG